MLGTLWKRDGASQEIYPNKNIFQYQNLLSTNFSPKILQKEIKFIQNLFFYDLQWQVASSAGGKSPSCLQSLSTT